MVCELFSSSALFIAASALYYWFAEASIVYINGLLSSFNSLGAWRALCLCYNVYWLYTACYKYIALQYTCKLLRRQHPTIYLVCFIFEAIPVCIVAILNPILVFTLDDFEEQHKHIIKLYHMVLIPLGILDFILLLLNFCVAISPDKTYKYLAKNKYLQPIEKNDACWNYVEMLVNKTWIYDEQIGHDAAALIHGNIEVKQIYRIYNDTLEYKGIYQSPEVEDNMKQGPSVLPKEGSHKTHSNVNQSAAQHENRESIELNSDSEIDLDNDPKRTILDSILTRKLVNELHRQNPTDCRIHENQPMGDHEVYLFHGTQHTNARKIIENGFDITKIKRKPYGKGIYLTESSQKADQYTGKYQDNFRYNSYWLLA